jgi:cystathionine beta-lyase/cystathionine gamma-synthase
MSPCHEGTATPQALARAIASIEGTEAALVTASGMAAISSTLLALLRPGDHLISQVPSELVNDDVLLNTNIT